jgi:hypothetical protein
MVGGMSPEEFQNYLGLLSRLLRLKATERQSIEDELRSHLEERLAALTAQGIEPTRAVSMALAEFGNAAALAAEFTAVSRLYKRRWIMRLTVGSIAASIVMAAVLVSYWPGGPARLTQNQAQAQQDEKVAASGESKETLALVAQERPDANAKTRAKLEKPGKAEFVDTPLSQALDYLHSFFDVQFHMDVRILNDAGLKPETPVKLALYDVPGEMILRWTLRDIGDLTYYLDNGVIIVTTQEEADSRLETQVYRIDDLIRFPATEKTGVPMDDLGNKPVRVHYDELVDLIETTVLPQTWDPVGGPGSISPYRGTLVISQTAEAHLKIQKLLGDLRRSINQQIEDEPLSSRSSTGEGMGGMGGGMLGGRTAGNAAGANMGAAHPADKEPQKKDAPKSSTENEKKDPRSSR